MPFALNEATRSISPTKTLEYLAAGLPVVSTRVPDVVSDFGELVDLQDGGEGFAVACRRVARHCPLSRAAKAEPLLHVHHWNTFAERMGELLATAVRKMRPKASHEAHGRPRRCDLSRSREGVHSDRSA